MTPNDPKWPQMTPNDTRQFCDTRWKLSQPCHVIMQNLALGMQDQDLRPEYLTTSILYFFVITHFFNKN